MHEIERYIAPGAARLALENLNTVTDESKLLDQMHHLSQEIDKLQQLNDDDSDDITELNIQMTALEVQVNYIRDQSRPDHQISSE